MKRKLNVNSPTVRADQAELIGQKPHPSLCVRRYFFDAPKGGA
jgi:hypothetical protein